MMTWTEFELMEKHVGRLNVIITVYAQIRWKQSTNELVLWIVKRAISQRSRNLFSNTYRNDFVVIIFAEEREYVSPFFLVLKHIAREKKALTHVSSIAI